MAATAPPQLMVFELYYGEQLVAADFAHPVCGGRAVYVATRFSARGHSKTSPGQGSGVPGRDTAEEEEDDEEAAAAIRTMQPGFILALLECRWLQQRGCELWDLGGYNLSPLMQYKLDLAGQPQQRPRALYEFRNCVRCTSASGDSSGGIGGQAYHPWGNEEEEEEERKATGAGSDSSFSLLFSTVRSGDTLVDDVQIEHLLGHASSVK